MVDRDVWKKVESFSRIFAAACIPVILGIGGWCANQTLEKSKAKEDLLKQAIEVVFLSKSEAMSGDGNSFENRRAPRKHWVELYNSLADVKLSNDFIAIVMEQDTVASEKEVYWTEHMPSLIAKNENAQAPENTNEDEMGHGWVAVGHVKSSHYSDLDFDISPGATERDGTIKPGKIIQVRWSVTLRSNPRNLEDRQGYAGTGRGLLWGGECAKVVDSLVDGRSQTWAFIEIVECPMRSHRDAVQHAVGSPRPMLPARPSKSLG